VYFEYILLKLKKTNIIFTPHEYSEVLQIRSGSGRPPIAGGRYREAEKSNLWAVMVGD